MCAIILILCFALIDPGQSTQEWVRERYSAFETSHRIPGRMINMSKTTYHDAAIRITEVNPIRFMYERSPFYEQGYVFSEIIERYKKMVEQYRKVVLFSSAAVFDCLDRVEHIQKLYFEIYHLGRMYHEIPRKYMGMKEFKAMMQTVEDENRKKQAAAAFAIEEKKRELEAQLLIYALKDDQKKIGGPGLKLSGQHDKDKYFGQDPADLKHEFPTRWPFDYGWEPVEW